ncbi:hypothetical protein NE237_011433 [Protea cynaroides]|uniref:Uncharacterized protein n=1 Tax=Protea cynaroides TaxID=273540 RepID=A0A9Q0JXX8_9MAGN|nr:hypothetical protein NE237_011433 [Protea cynaroides]
MCLVHLRSTITASPLPCQVRCRGRGLGLIGSLRHRLTLKSDRTNQRQSNQFASDCLNEDREICEYFFLFCFPTLILALVLILNLECFLSSNSVLLLELLKWKAPNQVSVGEEGIDLPRWVQSVEREEWTVEVFDVELLRYHNIEEEMVQFLQISVSMVPDQRPDIRQVVHMMEDIIGQTRMMGSICRPMTVLKDPTVPNHLTSQGLLLLPP